MPLSAKQTNSGKSFGIKEEREEINKLIWMMESILDPPSSIYIYTHTPHCILRDECIFVLERITLRVALIKRLGERMQIYAKPARCAVNKSLPLGPAPRKAQLRI